MDLHAGSPEKIQHNLKSAGLLSLIPTEHIASASHVTRGKPAPDVYVEAMRRTGCQDCKSAIVIEDTVHGLQAAKAAGIFAVGIANTLPAHVLQEHADLVITHLTDLDLATMQPPNQTV